MRSVASGKFVLRLPTGVHEALRREASRRGLSLNGLCRQVLVEHVQNASRPGQSDNESPLVEKIRDLIGEPLVGVVLFGSVARGDSREGSDVDLLVVLDEGQPVARELYSRWDDHFGADKHSPHFVLLPPNTAAVGSLWIEAAVDGVVYYDRAGKVSRFLGEIRRMIADGRLSRRLAYGLPYWVKNMGGAPHVQ
jgi:predicted nucleotidyltransferase